MVAGALKEHLIGDAIMKVLTRMDLVTNIDAAILRVIKDWSPACREFVKGGLDQTGGAFVATDRNRATLAHQKT